MPTVKLPVEFKILTCPNCGRPYGLVKIGIDLCPYCCSDILYKGFLLKVSLKKEVLRLKRSIRSLKGVITKKQNEIDGLKIFGPPDPNAPKVPKHEPIPKEFDFKNPKFYDVVETGIVCEGCDYLRLNKRCTSEFGYGFCSFGDTRVYKLKPEYSHLDPRNKK